MRRLRRFAPLAAAVLAIGLLVAACGGDDDDDRSPDPTDQAASDASTTTVAPTTASASPTTTAACDPIPAHPDVSAFPVAPAEASHCGLTLQASGTCPSADTVRLNASGFQGQQYRTSVWDSNGDRYVLSYGDVGDVTPGGHAANWEWTCEDEHNVYGNYLVLIEELGTGRWAAFVLPVLGPPA